MKILPWYQDKWLSPNGRFLKYDKLEHFIRDIGTGFIFGVIPSIIFNVVYEYIDGTRPYYLNSPIEGFSIKDLIAGLCGTLLGVYIRFKLTKIIYYGVF